MRVLGIETSCDETAVAVVEAPAGTGCAGRARSWPMSSTASSPSIAASAAWCRRSPRAPISSASTGWSTEALAEAGLGLADLDGIAATGGPGLIGGVMVGVMTAKALAFAHDKPFLAVNHLEGHALSVRLTEPVDFPYLLLLVSGGHCQLLTVRGPGDFTRLGTTIDDAVGECFDKTAKLLGLGFPGGPAVERAAAGGDPQRFALPRPMWRKPGCDFSFSGLKTAVRQTVEKLPPDDPARHRRSLRLVPAHGRRRAGRSLRQRARARAVTDRSSWRAASRPMSICAAGSKTLRRRTARGWSRRRSGSAPTTAP